MTSKSCGCTTSTCGCCEGTKRWTPADTSNRPGLKELRYRVGTHGEFFESMKARLATMTVDSPGTDGETVETLRPLTGLTTRDQSDPSMALLDGWATVGDVLTFYQERIANEGYLRTATERRSVLELARLVGYALRPGVASTVYLAYTLDDNQADPVEIPIGSRSQSIPGPGEFPQSFETAEKIVARTEWNNIQVRLMRPQNVSFNNVLELTKLYVVGTATNLKPGDKLLFDFGGNSPSTRFALRTVAAIVSDFTENRTQIQFQPLTAGTPDSVAALSQFILNAKPLVDASNVGADGRFYKEALNIQQDNLMGLYTDPMSWVESIEEAADVNLSDLSDNIEILARQLNLDIEVIIKKANAPSAGTITDPSKFVTPLLTPFVQQARSSAHLARSLGGAFQTSSDASPQLLVNFEPRLKDTYYTAWANADVNAATSGLQAIYALQMIVSLFGANVPKQASYYAEDILDGQKNILHKAGQLKPPSEWQEWDLENDEGVNSLFLDQAYDAILPSGYVMVQNRQSQKITRQVLQVSAAQTLQRTAYGTNGKTTQLTFNEDWRTIDPNETIDPTLRRTLVYAQSEELNLAEEPLSPKVPSEDASTDDQKREIELSSLYNELTSGRWVILSGERADIPGVTGVHASELMMISGLRHGYDPALPGDKTHTTLLLATPPAYVYKRETMTIYGNVAKATHGETRNETLGSGDGAQSLQTFVMKQPPLTFVPAPTVSGVESTLHVYVNDLEWHEGVMLAGTNSADRIFITKTDNEDKTSVIFGNGKEGARLPTGVENIKAVYRSGIGKAGNVRTEQISLLQSRPLGVKSVINPLRASGGASRENLDQARDNAPLAVMSLDRLVSLRDYEDFTRTFAGIGKAAVKRLTDGQREFLHLTIAGADDIPIDKTSDLYRNLLVALRMFGAPDLAVQVDSRELIALVLSANIKLVADYQWDPVVEKVREAILDEFGFSRRRLAQPALLCEVIGLIQGVRGVAYVDVDSFGGIPEKKKDTTNKVRRLLTPDEMAEQVRIMLSGADNSIRNSFPPEGVKAAAASFSGGMVSPAQLAIFTPAVPDTLIVNQIV